MAKKKANETKASRAATTKTSMLAHELEDLLRTIRKIARHEDELCTLAEAARTEHDDADLLDELETLLVGMSTIDYNGEVRAALLRLPSPLRKSTWKAIKPEKQIKNKTKKAK